MEKDMTSFWKGIEKNSNARVPLAPMIDNCIGDKEICNMWQAHYKTLLNSVKISSSEAFVKKNFIQLRTRRLFLPYRHF